MPIEKTNFVKPPFVRPPSTENDELITDMIKVHGEVRFALWLFSLCFDLSPLIGVNVIGPEITEIGHVYIMIIVPENPPNNTI